jgi:hypothetical protein
VFRSLAAWDKKFSEFETVVWSVFISLMIYSFYGSVTGNNSMDAIAGSVFQPAYLVTLIIALTISIGIGSIVKVAFRRTIEVGDVWDAFCGRHIKVGDWVTVYTNDGHEYKGRLSSYGFGESKKEISIRNPKLILRDRTGKATRETLSGEEVLFTERDVLRIAALTSEQEKP